MITAQQVRETIRRALAGSLPDVVTVYTGVIPGSVPTYPGGDIKPYVGLWFSNPTGLGEMTAVSGLADVDAKRLRVQTQVVAANERDVYEVADLLVPALTNLDVGGYPVVPDFEQHQAANIITDTTGAHPTPYLPLFWEIETQ